MNGKRKRFLSFVGAMKIARQPGILASTPMNGVHQSPAPSLRELSSECETEGVYFVARKRSKISEFIMAGG